MLTGENKSLFGRLVSGLLSIVMIGAATVVVGLVFSLKKIYDINNIMPELNK